MRSPRLLLLLAAPCLAAPCLAAAAADARGPVDPALLAKLAAFDARSEKAMQAAPILQHQRAEELDGSGKVEHLRTATFRVTHVGDKDKSELLHAEVDGKDATAEVRKKVGSEAGESEEQIDSPFAANQQGKYRFELLGAAPGEPGLVRIGFGPKGKDDEKLMRGEAVVDPESGAVRRMHGQPSEYPRFVSKALFDLEYEPPAQGPRILHLRAEFEGGLLFIHKRGRVETRFEYPAVK